MRLLIIEDDSELREVLKSSLESEGFVVDVADNGETGSYMARTSTYNVILLDNILPKKNGLVVCREIKAVNKNVPILIMSVRHEESEKVAFLENGADDYLSKPFSFAELVARTKVLLRRPYSVQDPVLTIDDLTVDTVGQNVSRGNKRIYLTRKEFMLLECLARQSGKVVSRGQIVEQVWERESDLFSNTLEAHIRNLRKKVDTKQRKLIHTISGRGYKLDRSK